MSTFVHMELNTSDPEAAKQFYEAVFGWTYQDTPMPEGVYTMVNAPDGGIGGITQQSMPDAPSQWVGYIGVDSVDETIDRVEEAGGTVLVPETEIPGMGSFAVFTDPQGAAFAVWEVAAPPEEEPAIEAPSKKKSSTKKAAKKSAKSGEAAAEPPAERRTSKKKAARREEEPPSKKAGKKAAKKTSEGVAQKKAGKKAAKKTSEGVAKKAGKKAAKKTGKKAAKKTAKKSARR
jgi:predicted enzyme related to lactoylglutathione lyase